jgi:hypothetical protein
MSVGHHIDDRAHIMQRSRNYYTGEEEQNNEYINIEDTEGPEFNLEWQRRHAASTGSYGRSRNHQRALAESTESAPPRMLALPPCEPTPSSSVNNHTTTSSSNTGTTSGGSASASASDRPHRPEKAKKHKSRKEKKPYTKP